MISLGNRQRAAEIVGTTPEAIQHAWNNSSTATRLLVEKVIELSLMVKLGDRRGPGLPNPPGYVIQYPELDPEELGPAFFTHLDAMTREGLHSKAEIARQLAHRDNRIAELEARLGDSKPARSKCNDELIAAGEPNPRTCEACGLGPCKERPPERDPDDDWAKVELFRWQHGELPQPGDTRKLHVPTALKKMAEAFEEEEPGKWPARFNLVSVLKFCSRQMN